MTTTVTIKHEGPDHHDILIVSGGPNEEELTEARLKEGEKVKLYFWGANYLKIKEVNKNE